MTTPPDVSRIDKEIEIQAPPARVWRALTDAAEVSAWFQMTIEGPIATAGQEFWMTSTSPGHEGQRGLVRVIELVEPRRVVWQWHPGGVDPSVDYATEPMTTVTFTLTPSGSGTRLTVSETGFDAIALTRRARVHADNTGGWEQVVVWLKTHVEASR